MHNYLIYTTIFLILSALSCGEDKPTDDTSKAVSATDKFPKKPTPLPNKWSSPEALGAPSLIINFSQKDIVLKDDTRVNSVHKQQVPIITEEYVLWRVRHNGSCWLYSGMMQFFYQAIEAGDKKFSEIIKEIKKIFSEGEDAHLAQNQALADDFLALLELMQEKMDHRHCLELINHEKVVAVLDPGFRRLLSIITRKQGLSTIADEIEEPNSWGHASHFGYLFDELGFKFAEISSDGDFHKNTPATRSIVSLGQYITRDGQRSILENNREKYAHIRKDMPVVISFRSSPGYMDVAVLKSFAQQLSKNK